MIGFRQITGAVLCVLTVASAALAIGGVWGFIDGDTAGQLFGTFLVVGLTTVCLGYVVSKFFGRKP
jgi:hypothetical protein